MGQGLRNFLWYLLASRVSLFAQMVGINLVCFLEQASQQVGPSYGLAKWCVLTKAVTTIVPEMFQSTCRFMG